MADSSPKTLMQLLKQLSRTYQAYDRGALSRARAEVAAERVLAAIELRLRDGRVREALRALRDRASFARIPAANDNQTTQHFVSVELQVTDGYGFTRSDVSELLRDALGRRTRELDTTADSEPADLLLQHLHELNRLQFEQLAAAKQLGRKPKKRKKKLVRKGLFKVTGGVAIVVADALYPHEFGPASYLVGGNAIMAGIDDMVG